MQKLVVGNWKMHGTRAQVEQLMLGIRAGLDPGWSTEVAVCPPFVYIPWVIGLAEGSPIQVGAQNMSVDPPGPRTGEVAGAMLVDLGCRFVILGHSERREFLAEDDLLVARKFLLAQSLGLVPILCVGETLAQRDAGTTRAVILGQLDAVLDLAGADAFAHAVIAYEPVWAIGTGRTATPEQAAEVHALIRARLQERAAAWAGTVRILYGGSVKADNAAALFGRPEIDGGLVGGASLDSDAFLTICKAAERGLRAC